MKDTGSGHWFTQNAFATTAFDDIFAWSGLSLICVNDMDNSK